MTPTGTTLALSGGGFRAMLFHVGGLVRLDEAGILSRLDRVSSVSGGSIAAAALAKHWDAVQTPGHVLDTGATRSPTPPIRKHAGVPGPHGTFPYPGEGV